MTRPKRPLTPQGRFHAARLRVEEAVGRAVRAPAFSCSAPGDAERVAFGNTGRRDDRTGSRPHGQFRSGRPSTFAALFPVGDRSVQVRTIDPHSPETWRPNSRQIS